MPSFGQVLVWIAIGLVAGTLVGSVVRWDKAGFGRGRNLGLGLAGALVGGLLFRLLGLFPELDRYAVSMRDVIAAVVGALLVLSALWLWQHFSSR
jgi:uncharacterized membrane protein YeaQ/YmgE (transglycosylase-associated protein family)